MRGLQLALEDNPVQTGSKLLHPVLSFYCRHFSGCSSVGIYHQLPQLSKDQGVSFENKSFNTAMFAWLIIAPKVFRANVLNSVAAKGWPGWLIEKAGIMRLKNANMQTGAETSFRHSHVPASAEILTTSLRSPHIVGVLIAQQIFGTLAKLATFAN
jgi:hypothetical protein